MFFLEVDGIIQQRPSCSDEGIHVRHLFDLIDDITCDLDAYEECGCVDYIPSAWSMEWNKEVCETCWNEHGVTINLQNCFEAQRTEWADWTEPHRPLKLIS